jgi:hypothetical protein
VIGPLLKTAKSTGRPPVDRRTVVERDVPVRFGNWNTIYKNFNRWSARGVRAWLFRNRSGLLPHWVFPGALLARVQAQPRVSPTLSAVRSAFSDPSVTVRQTKIFTIPASAAPSSTGTLNGTTIQTGTDSYRPNHPRTHI